MADCEVFFLGEHLKCQFVRDVYGIVLYPLGRKKSVVGYTAVYAPRLPGAPKTMTHLFFLIIVNFYIALTGQFPDNLSNAVCKDIKLFVVRIESSFSKAPDLPRFALMYLLIRAAALPFSLKYDS